MNMMNANLGIENLKEKNFTEKQIKDFDPDKRSNEIYNVSEENHGKESFEPDKRIDTSQELSNKNIMEDVGFDKRINSESNTVNINTKSEDNKLKAVERGNELTQQQKEELLSYGMSPGIINDCTYKDGVYQLKTVYNKFEGRTLADTGVTYLRKTIDYFGVKMEGVFPKFEPTFTAHLPIEKLRASDKTQFSECVLQLQKELVDDPSLRSNFSPRQLEQIAHGKTPGGYVWHHNEEIGKMELVRFDVHDVAKHTGGRAIWGGGGQAR